MIQRAVLTRLKAFAWLRPQPEIEIVACSRPKKAGKDEYPGRLFR